MPLVSTIIAAVQPAPSPMRLPLHRVNPVRRELRRVALALFLLAGFVGTGPLRAAEPTLKPIRVLIWDEQQPEQKRAYHGKFLGETIAAHLATRPGLSVKSVTLTSPSQGLDETTLSGADILIWWSHQKNAAVNDDNVERVVARVREGRPCTPPIGRVPSFA